MWRFPAVACFVGGGWFHWLMPRKRERDAPPVVYRTARCGLRVTRNQRERLFGLLRSAGDVWCAVLELNSWRRRRQDAPLVGYRELAVSGPGTFGELDSTAARSVLRRYSDAWFAAAARRKAGDTSARFPRRIQVTFSRHETIPAQHTDKTTDASPTSAMTSGTEAPTRPRRINGRDH